jgi:hypothetical protein
MSRPAYRSRRALLRTAAALTAAGLLRPISALAADEGDVQAVFKPFWVQNVKETALWSGVDEKAKSFGTIAPFSYFQVLEPQNGPRLRVKNPIGGGIGYINAGDVGPSGAPPEDYVLLQTRVALPARVVGGANVRRRPVVEDGTLVANLGHNAGIGVIDEVKGADGEMWYRIDKEQFVHNSLVRKPGAFSPHGGKYLVAELTDPCIVTAYEDGRPVYAALALKGKIGWGTPTGFFTIVRRVANETMNSETLGIPRGAPGGYYLKDVLYTQYFTGDGASIHYNYWSSNFGYSGSHGCLGMNLEDSRWFWDWADIGTPLFIKE